MSAPFCAERVAGEGVAELGHGADVAGVELGDFDGLAALHDAEVREFFLAAAGVVFKRGVVFDDAADDFEEGDAAGEGVGHGFEDDGARRARSRRLCGRRAGASAAAPGTLTAMGARSVGAGA